MKECLKDLQFGFLHVINDLIDKQYVDSDVDNSLQTPLYKVNLASLNIVVKRLYKTTNLQLEDFLRKRGVFNPKVFST